MSSSHPTPVTSRGALLLAAALFLAPAVASAQQGPERGRVPEAAAQEAGEGAQQRCAAGPEQAGGQPSARGGQPSARGGQLSARGGQRPALGPRGRPGGPAARGGRGGPPAGRGLQAGLPPQARERMPAQARERINAAARGEGEARSERGPRGGVRPDGSATPQRPCGSE